MLGFDCSSADNGVMKQGHCGSPPLNPVKDLSIVRLTSVVCIVIFEYKDDEGAEEEENCKSNSSSSNCKSSILCRCKSSILFCFILFCFVLFLCLLVILMRLLLAVIDRVVTD